MFEAYLEPIVRRAAKLELGDEKPPIRERAAFHMGKLFNSKSNHIPQYASNNFFHDGEGTRRVNSGARVHSGMIRRMNNAPQRIGPSGFTLEEAKQTTTPEMQPHSTVLESPPFLSDSPQSLSRSLAYIPPIDETSSIAFRNSTDDDQQPASRSSVQHATTSSRYTTDPNQLSARRVSRTERAPSVVAYGREEKRSTIELPRTATTEFAGLPQVQKWTSPIRERSTGVGIAASSMGLTNKKELWSDRKPSQYSKMGEPGSKLPFIF